MVHISHPYKFIYIKNVKVAGSYLSMILTKYCTTKPHIQHIENCYNNSTFMKYNETTTEVGFISSWCYKKTNKILNCQHCNHADSNTIKDKFPNIFDNYFKFCVARNPYDRIVSRYYWDIKINEIPKDMSFTTYLENEANNPINKMNDDWYHRCTLDGSSLQSPSPPWLVLVVVCLWVFQNHVLYALVFFGTPLNFSDFFIPHIF